LRLLIAANQKQDYFGTIFRKVDSVARSDVDSEFSDAISHRFTVSEIPLLQTVNSNFYDRTAVLIAQGSKPIPEGLSS
jgi:hypothetical protein